MDEIVEVYKNQADNTGLPVFTNEEWELFKNKYDKDTAKKALAKYIIDYNVQFPFRPISYDRVKDRFNKLLNKNLYEFVEFNLQEYDIEEKWDDYKYPFSKYGIALIDASPYYNDISDYYQQKNRLSCGAYSHLSPMDYWRNKEKLEKLNWTFWRKGITEGNDINNAEYRKTFRLGTYTATQFKPPVAKAVYSITMAKKIIDMSCGWGDRLAGFYTTPHTEEYFGCDPNIDTYHKYKEQCIAYETILGNKCISSGNDEHFDVKGGKFVRIFRKPAEEMNWGYKQFDCAFTSPPYYATELYNKGGDNEDEQSWHRYPKYEDWRDKFLFRMLDRAWFAIKDDGYLALNIMDPKVKSKRYHTCDELVDHMTYKSDCNFVGQIGMRIMRRPKKMDGLQEMMKKIYIENIWLFKKVC